jgi:hypothetical protein
VVERDCNQRIRHRRPLSIPDNHCSILIKIKKHTANQALLLVEWSRLQPANTAKMEKSRYKMIKLALPILSAFAFSAIAIA